MFSRVVAAAAAASLLVASTPALAQSSSTTPTQRVETQTENQTGDLLLILGAIVAAGLLTFLATQIGGNDDPASP